MPQRRDVVVQRDEAPVLPSVAEPAAETCAEQREEPPPGAALPGDDQSGARVHGPHTGLLRGGRCFLPLHAHRRQETVTGRCALVDRTVPGVAVEADRRPGQQHLGRYVQRGHGLGDRARPQHPAVPDLPLVRVGPAVVADPGPGEMDDCVAAHQPGHVHVTPSGVPLDLVAGPRRVPDQPDHLVSVGPQRAHQRRSDESGRSGDSDTGVRHGAHPAPWFTRHGAWHSGAHG